MPDTCAYRCRTLHRILLFIFLNEKCLARKQTKMNAPTLKEQLREKELVIYELELQVNTLKADIEDLCDAQEKLEIANQNARILEEENSNLLNKMKSMVSGEIDASFFPAGMEAAKLIRESSNLRHKLLSSENTVKELTLRVSQLESDLERLARDANGKDDKLRMENERVIKELESSRGLCVENQHHLESEQEAFRSSADLWEKERARYSQKIEDLLASGMRPSSILTNREFHSSGKSTDIPIQQVLLQEEVEQLEDRLKKAQERQWVKEKSWLKTEVELKKELALLQQDQSGDHSLDREVIRALQSQVSTLKEEILTLRNSQRTGRTVPSLTYDDDKESLLQENIMKPQHMASNKPSQDTSSKSLMEKLQVSYREKDNLKEQLDDLRGKLFNAQALVEERNLRCKELEVALAAANNKVRQASQRLDSGNPTTPDEGRSRFTGASLTILDVSEAKMQRQIRDLQNELSEMRAAKEQTDAINSIRIKEYQYQIEELLQENENIRHFDDFEPEEHGKLIADQSSAVTRLLRDKRDSVEDVMRLLEGAWSAEEQFQHAARQAAYRGTSKGSNDTLKDDEIRRLHQIIDNLQDPLNAAEADRKVTERMRMENDRRGGRMGRLEEEIEDLKERLKIDRERKDNNIRGLSRENEALREKVMAIEKERPGSGAVQRSGVQKQDDQQREFDAPPSEHNRYKRDVARSQRKDLSASNRSPRVSARHRTTDYTTLSQLSVRSSDERKRTAIPEGAHLSVTVLELSDVLRNGRSITEPGFVIIKLKSIKEKYKTSVKELSSVIRFDESFEFYLAQPDQDVITLHIFYKPKGSSREYHVGDACFSMATLYRGIPRYRIAPVVQNPGSKEARPSGQVEVVLQTDDFGKMAIPSDAELEDEKLRFIKMTNKFQNSAPERLHAVDVYVASTELQ